MVAQRSEPVSTTAATIPFVLQQRSASDHSDATFWPCCSMAIMATEIDPAGIMPRALLNAADFRDVRVLEVGAGDGRLTFQYATEARSVVGIDTKEPDIRSASQRPVA